MNASLSAFGSRIHRFLLTLQQKPMVQFSYVAVGENASTGFPETGSTLLIGGGPAGRNFSSLDPGLTVCRMMIAAAATVRT